MAFTSVCAKSGWEPAYLVVKVLIFLLNLHTFASLRLRPAVLKLLRLEDHLQILSLGCGPPLKFCALENCQNWSVCVFISLKNKTVTFAREPPGRCSWTTG